MNEKANILVVDDEVGPRESLKMVLSPYHNVYLAESGSRAIEMVERQPFDLVTLDLKMPGLSGIKVLEKVKEHDPDIEAIIVTGYGSMDTAIQGLRLGAFDYISKPFDVPQVVSLVQRAIERRNAKQRLRQVRDDFLSDVSHELRTPLGIVIGYISLLLDQLIGDLSADQHRILGKVYSTTEELLDLIDNVLCLSSLNAGSLVKRAEEFDLATVVRQNLRKCEEIAADKGVDLVFQPLSPKILLVSDPDKIDRIVRNLLHNALKFTEQGQIAIRAHSALPGKAVLEIVDTGIGTEAARASVLARPAGQSLNSPEGPFQGLGLGLTVAKRLAGFLGGSLELKSQRGVGTQVSVELPLVPSYLEEEPSVVGKKARQSISKDEPVTG
jgi:signal transduction histidine kinase